MIRLLINLCFAFLLMAYQNAFAQNGLLFDVTSTGTPANITISLCLNGNGPLSCQNYTVSGVTLRILTAIPNHNYPSVGIRVLTPGYNPSGCTPIANGYCLFSANHTTPAAVSLAQPAPPPPPPAKLIPSIAVGYYQITGNNYSPIAYLSTDNGKTWGTPTFLNLPNAASSAQIYGVTCTGASCTAVGCIGTPGTAPPTTPSTYCSSPLAYYSSDNGKTWSVSFTPSASGYLSSISCVDSNCTAAGYDPSGAVIYQSTDKGATWGSVTVLPPGPNFQQQLNSITCVSSTCNAVGGGFDSSGSVLFSYTSTDNGATWSSPNNFQNYPFSSFTFGEANGISCVGSSCATVGVATNFFSVTTNSVVAFYSIDNATNWIPSTITGVTNGQLNGISCVNTNCSAIGYANPTTTPLAYSSTDNGANWSSPINPALPSAATSGQLNGVSCASSLCNAVGYSTDGFGNTSSLTYYSTDNGATWSAPISPSGVTGGELWGIYSVFNAS